MRVVQHNRVARSLLLLSLILPANSARSQSEQATSSSGIDYEAVLVVEGLWNFASAGDLLNQEGWTRAISTRYFTDPSSSPKDASFRVVGNRYWITNISHEGAKLMIPMETTEIGQIDSTLQFNPARHDNADFYAYRLVYGPTPKAVWTSDGKKLGKQTVAMTGPNCWRIEGSLKYRWTTLNTAILYVMDARDKSKDPAIRRNADKTLDVLRKYR